MDEVDVTILGGGAAGLSLAAALVASDTPPETIRIVEPRTAYQRDRTWCFWDHEAPLHPEAIAHRWPAWTVRHADRTTRRRGRYDYVEIPANRFYDAALDRLSRDPRVELLLGARATATRRHGDRVLVETDRGPVSSRFVFDSRPRERSATEASSGLWQHFAGHRVRTTRPVFDPSAVVLMDFDVPQDRGIHFFYVLPYSPCEALVEATFFSSTPLVAAEYDAAIDRYLRVRFGVDDYEVIGREQGRLPMFDARARPCVSGIVPIGITGGACRPSTGYAFLAIQRHARMLARWVAEGGDERRRPTLRSPWIRWMDRVFLRVLERRPDRAGVLFAGLFDRADPDALVRFLMEGGDLRDALSVMRALPHWPFLREAMAPPVRLRLGATS